MRINRLLAMHLAISRRAADKLIASGQVNVKGRPAVAGTDVELPEDVLINNKPLPAAPAYSYILFNKPVGYVCSRNGQGSKTIYRLLPAEYRKLQTVGRLDKNSSGLLLLTNDGRFHNKLAHPSFKKEKTYRIKLDRQLKAADKHIIESGGITLSEGISKMIITGSGRQWQVRLHEGRKRQIRRTFKALDYHILELERLTFGPYRLGDLKPGGYRLVKPDS